MSVSDEELAKAENVAWLISHNTSGDVRNAYNTIIALVAALRREKSRAEELEGIAGEAGRLSAEVDDQTERIAQLEAELEKRRSLGHQYKQEMARMSTDPIHLEAERDELRAEVERLQEFHACVVVGHDWNADEPNVCKLCGEVHKP